MCDDYVLLNHRNVSLALAPYLSQAVGLPVCGVVLHLQTRPVLHLPHYNSAEWCYTYKPDQCYTSRITTSRSGATPTNHTSAIPPAEWCYTYKPDQCYTSRTTTSGSGATPTNQTSATPPALQQRGVVLHLQTRPVLHLPHYNSAEWCYTYKPDHCYTSRITTARSGATPTNQTSATPPTLQPRGVVLHLQTRPVLYLPHYNSAEWCYTYIPDQCYTSRITTSRSGATPTNHTSAIPPAEWCYTYKPDQCYTSRTTTSGSGATPTNQTSATPPALQQRGVVLHLQTRPVLHLPHYNLAEWCYTYKPYQCYTSRGVVLHLQTRPVLHLPHYNLREWCYTYKPYQCYTSRITTARSGATPTNQTSATPPASQPRGVVLQQLTRPVLHLPHYNSAEWCYTYKPDQCYTARITTTRSVATPTNQTSATPPALQPRGVVLHLLTKPVLHRPHYNSAEWCFTY